MTPCTGLQTPFKRPSNATAQFQTPFKRPSNGVGSGFKPPSNAFKRPSHTPPIPPVRGGHALGASERPPLAPASHRNRTSTQDCKTVDDSDPCTVLDERVAAFSALNSSARYAAAVEGVPEAERDALLAVAAWADRAVAEAITVQTAMLEARMGQPA